MARKTADISRIVEMANNVMLNTADSEKAGRAAVQTFVECVLMEAGQYRGFRYLTPRDMLLSEQGVSYGINPCPYTPENGYGPRDAEGWDQFEGTDNTRVEYHG